VLEATFGAGLDVLTHLGMPVVVDSGRDPLSAQEPIPSPVGLGARAAGHAGTGNG
jgi:hypothetical protein